MFRRTPLTVPALILLLASACGGASNAETTDKPADGPDLSSVDFEDARGVDEVVVEVRDNSFSAPYVEVDAGTTVIFTNVGRTEHNVYPVADGAFTPIDATDLEPDEAREITFDEPGEVPYYCTLHGSTTKGMVGAIRVV